MQRKRWSRTVRIVSSVSSMRSRSPTACSRGAATVSRPVSNTGWPGHCRVTARPAADKWAGPFLGTEGGRDLPVRLIRTVDLRFVGHQAAEDGEERPGGVRTVAPVSVRTVLVPNQDRGLELVVGEEVRAVVPGGAEIFREA